jgi:hypothetical protein
MDYNPNVAVAVIGSHDESQARLYSSLFRIAKYSDIRITSDIEMMLVIIHELKNHRGPIRVIMDPNLGNPGNVDFSPVISVYNAVNNDLGERVKLLAITARNDCFELAEKQGFPVQYLRIKPFDAQSLVKWASYTT